MTFRPNPNFADDFGRGVQDTMRRVVENLDRTLRQFSVTYSGQDVTVVRPALAAAWAGTNKGAKISEPELTQCATAVADGGRIWVDDRGHVMINDGRD